MLSSLRPETKITQNFKIPLPCQFLGNQTGNKHKSIINKLNTNSSCTEKEGKREGSLVGEELIEALGKERSRVSDEDRVGRVENGAVKGVNGGKARGDIVFGWGMGRGGRGRGVVFRKSNGEEGC